MKVRSRRRWPWVLGVLALLGAAGVTLRATRAKGEPIDESRVVLVERRELAIEIVEVGRIEPERQVELKSKVAGVVAEVRVEEGDEVAQGDLLLRLDAVDAKRDLARAGTEASRAKSGLAFAELEAKRADEGLRQGLTSRATRDIARGASEEKRWALALSRVAVSAARDRLSYTRLVAPIAGTVIHRGIEAGETVTPGVEATADGKPLLTIADLSRLLVKVDLNQIDVAKVRLGQAVRVRVDALPERSYSAKITRIAPASLRRPGKEVDVFPVEALLIDAGARIKPGMTAEVKIDVETKRDALALPIEAVRKTSGKSLVTRVIEGDKGPKREEVEVTVGSRNDRDVEVMSGIAAGDRILLEPGSAAANETKI